MREERFDLVVVGTGTGLDVANSLVSEGWNVAIVEKDSPGGTCLVRGCIPSKMLIHSADVAETIRTAATFGLQPSGFKVDYAALMKRVRDHVDGESREIRDALRASRNPRFFEGTGRFVGVKRLQVGDVVLSADKFLLASGARPKIPEIPGLRERGFLTSTDALSRATQPKSLAIMGGGFIAAELGHFFGALGTNVTVIVKHDAMLNHEEPEISAAFTEAFAKRHRVILHAMSERVDAEGRIHLSNGDVVEADEILVAIGVTPNSDTLDLDKTGVQTDAGGRIVVDAKLETTQPGIFALGDAVGRYNLKHAANFEGQYAYQNLRSPDDKFDVPDVPMPSAVFSSPQVASVGAKERQLREKGVPFRVGRWKYFDTGMGKAIDDRDGFVKLLVHAENDAILGCHIVGTDASTLIHEVVLAINMGATARDLAETVHVHPALSEVLQRAASNLQPNAKGNEPTQSRE